jgi:hypothetical protein
MSLIPKIIEMNALTPATLDDLWAEAETLGIVRIRTKTDLYDKVKRGYAVTIIGHRRSTKMEIEKEHPSLHCAIADAINEAREMGLGEPG